MSWKLETDAAKFLQRHQEFLLLKEAENNFLLQALTRSVQNTSQKNLGFETSDGAIAFLYEGTLLFASNKDYDSGSLAEFLNSHFSNEKARKLTQKVFGPEHLVQSFTRAWLNEQKGLRTSKQFSMILHKLTQVNPVEKKLGQFRRAWIEELDHLSAWFKNFCEDTGVGNETGLPEEKIVLQMINSKQLFVWGNPRAVSMSGISGSTPKGIRINCVYTPREKRGQGFAKSLVTAVCELQLSQDKEFVVLFSDALQPQNAALYKSIGFDPIGSYINYTFSS